MIVDYAFPVPDVSKIEERPVDKIFPDRVKIIKGKKCVVCGIDVIGFDDELSQVEYFISGLCQKCQNDFFDE